MQFRIFSAFVIFIGSYLPLALILAVQDIPFSWWGRSFCDISKMSECYFNSFSNPYLSIAFLLITFVSVILSNISLKKISFPFEARVKKTKAIPNDIINYVFPYVVSFMGISYEYPEKLLGFAVFLIWMFAITYKSGQIIMNPLLLMFGWKLYEAEIEINGNERSVRVLYKGNLIPGDYSVQTIQDCYVARGG
ncbi:hypothetical protein [Marinobacterium iners]|uniref:Uncharacterized protein n=1 Tax=Marinobacterium iners DSM 11526 TaxID=1122198 RepID=A0A1H4B1X1_9GAMM|nr:hypothetical protein [Marinobacterium iners]SEA42074.1 hypothetical protein SAMN02745729_103144 [Marinobacterium iners DSM 11526]